MNIGIDVDGTLIDISQFMLEKGEAYFHRSPDDPAAFDVNEMFSCTDKERTGFWKKYLLKYCTASPVIDSAAETIKKLHKDGHRIMIVTSRVFTTGRGPAGFLFRTMLIKWLKRHGIVYDEIVFCEDSGEAKLEQCRRLGVDVMIDDKPDNLITISQKLPVIAFPMPWNRGIADRGIPAAKNWKDVRRIIEKMA